MYFGWSCMSWRQPAPISAAVMMKRHHAAGKADGVRERRPLIGNGGHLPRSERLQKRARAFQIELGVSRFDAQEEAVAAGEREARNVEHRMIRLRQSVQ